MKIDAQLKNIADGFKEDEQPETAAPSPAQRPRLILQPLSELLNAPHVPTDYIWSERLVVGTVSLLVSKPKVGKSTLARNLCLAVARGESFLGWPCKQGAVVYLALEERIPDVSEDFRSLGAEDSDPIYICDDSGASTTLLCEMMRENRPALVVVDPLQRLTKVSDGQSYSENYNAIGPLIDAARDSGTHVMLCHHSSKVEKADSIDSPLGSTALSGTACTVLTMKRTTNFRTLETRQRRGSDLPETSLVYCPESKRLTTGMPPQALKMESVATQILAKLGDTPQTETDLLDGIEVAADTKRNELRKLASEGKIYRSGRGRRGHPYLYWKGALFPFGASDKKPDENSCHEDILGTSVEEKKDSSLTDLDIPQTSKRESAKSHEIPTNEPETLVPLFPENTGAREKPRRAFLASETGEIELEF